MFRRQRLVRIKYGSLLVMAVLAILSSIGNVAQSDKLTTRSFRLSTANQSVIASYDFNFTTTGTTTLGSITFSFCGDSPLPSSSCGAPSGLDLSNAIITTQLGETGFSIDKSLSSSNEIVITRTAAPISQTQDEYTFGNVLNPDTIGEYFVRVATFASNDASGPESDFGGFAFDIYNSFPVSAEVPPYLTFCVGTTIADYDCSTATGNYIDFGELSSAHPSTGTTQAVAATNAQTGYNISVLGDTLTSGNNIVDALAQNTTSQAGTNQFGINLRANSNPAVGQDSVGTGSGAVMPNYALPNSFRFVSGEAVANANVPEGDRKYTVSYIVNVSPNQPPGVYVTTLTYVCLANF